MIYCSFNSNNKNNSHDNLYSKYKNDLKEMMFRIEYSIFFIHYNTYCLSVLQLSVTIICNNYL